MAHLRPSEIKTVRDEYILVRKSLDTVIPILDRELRSPSQDPSNYEQMIQAVKKIEKLMRRESGFFSHPRRLISHAQHQLKKLK